MRSTRGGRGLILGNSKTFTTAALLGIKTLDPNALAQAPAAAANQNQIPLDEVASNCDFQEEVAAAGEVAVEEVLGESAADAAAALGDLSTVDSVGDESSLSGGVTSLHLSTPDILLRSSLEEASSTATMNSPAPEASIIFSSHHHLETEGEAAAAAARVALMRSGSDVSVPSSDYDTFSSAGSSSEEIFATSPSQSQMIRRSSPEVIYAEPFRSPDNDDASPIYATPYAVTSLEMIERSPLFAANHQAQAPPQSVAAAAAVPHSFGAAHKFKSFAAAHIGSPSASHSIWSSSFSASSCSLGSLLSSKPSLGSPGSGGVGGSPVGGGRLKSSKSSVWHRLKQVASPPKPPARSASTVLSTQADIEALRSIRKEILRRRGASLYLSSAQAEFNSLTRWIFEGGIRQRPLSPRSGGGSGLGGMGGSVGVGDYPSSLQPPLRGSRLLSECKKIAKNMSSRPCALIFKKARKSIFGQFLSKFECYRLANPGSYCRDEPSPCPKVIKKILNEFDKGGYLRKLEAAGGVVGEAAAEAAEGAAEAAGGASAWADLRIKGLEEADDRRQPIAVIFKSGEIWCAKDLAVDDVLRTSLAKSEFESWKRSSSPEGLNDDPYFVDKDVRRAFFDMLDSFDDLEQILREELEEEGQEEGLQALTEGKAPSPFAIMRSFEEEVVKVLPLLTPLPNLAEYLNGIDQSLMSLTKRCLLFHKFHTEIVEKKLFSSLPECQAVVQFAQQYAKFYETFWLNIVLPARKSGKDQRQITADVIREALTDALARQ